MDDAKPVIPNPSHLSVSTPQAHYVGLLGKCWFARRLGQEPSRTIDMLAFIHVERTAGRTVSRILRNSFGIRHFDVQPGAYARNQFRPFLPEDLDWVCKLYPGLVSIAGHSVTPFAGLEDVRKDIRYFSVMRDPIRQVASFYQFICALDGRTYDFEETISQGWLRNMQTKRLSGGASAEAARKMIIDKEIFIGLQENFDESMVMLKTLIEPRLDICYVSEHVAASQGVSHNLLGSDHYRNLIEEAVSADLQLYEWVREELYPSYQKSFHALTGVDASTVKVDNRGARFRKNWYFNLLYRHGIYKPLLMLRRYQTHRQLRVD